MRCFTPVDIKHRGKLWGALAPSPMDTHEAYAGRWHRQLVCGLVTLFAQVTFCLFCCVSGIYPVMFCCA